MKIFCLIFMMIFTVVHEADAKAVNHQKGHKHHFSSFERKQRMHAKQEMVRLKKNIEELFLGTPEGRDCGCFGTGVFISRNRAMSRTSSEHLARADYAKRCQKQENGKQIQSPMNLSVIHPFRGEGGNSEGIAVAYVPQR